MKFVCCLYFLKSNYVGKFNITEVNEKRIKNKKNNKKIKNNTKIKKTKIGLICNFISYQGF